MSKPTLTVKVQWDGVTFTDVSAYVSGQLSTSRGRSRETDQYTTGTCSFTLRNEDRRFDPSNTAGPYYPGVAPGVRMFVTLDGVNVFTGYVDDLDVVYDKPNICTVNVSCVDGFGLLANAYLVNFTPPSETADVRISRVLTAVNYPSGLSTETGISTLQAGSFNRIAALDHVQTAARSENGFAFVNANGILTFYNRNHVGGLTPSLTFSDLGGTDYPYTAITQKSQALLLYNQAIGTRSGGTQQEADDAASQAQYQLRTLNISSLENNTDQDVLGLCQYLVSRYSSPDVRFDTLTVSLNAITSSTARATLLGLDLVSMVTVKRTPGGSGSPSTISLTEVIDGVSCAFDASAGTFQVTYRLGSVDTRAFLVLDDPVFGLLDSNNKLGF